MLSKFPKHPIVSTVLYLSSHSKVGGPTLVTNQRLRNPTTTNLNSVRGWLVSSKPSRLVCFDGSVLHGVIPGKGVIPPPPSSTSTSSTSSIKENELSDSDKQGKDQGQDQQQQRPRRVTLMMAFWKDIEVRKGSKPGSARPWPTSGIAAATLATKKKVKSSTSSSSSVLPSWAIELNRIEIGGITIDQQHQQVDDLNFSSSRNKNEDKIIPIRHVYELLDGEPVPKYNDNDGSGDGYYMPEYDRVFQGF